MEGIPDVKAVGADDLRGFIINLQEREKFSNHPTNKRGGKLSQSTIATYTKGIKVFWSWLEKEGYIEGNPLTKVKIPKVDEKLPKVLSEDDIIKLAKVMDGSYEKIRDKIIFLVLLDTGLRLSEIANLNEGDVDLSQKLLKVRGKGGREAYVPISDEAADEINMWIEIWRCLFDRKAGVNALFVTRSGKPLKAGQIQKNFARYSKVAGIKLSPHMCRHTCATMMLRNGANLETVKQILRHKNIKVTEQYLHLSQRDIEEAHQRYTPLAKGHLYAADL
jgi:site-specific recombinase XerD